MKQPPIGAIARHVHDISRLSRRGQAGPKTVPQDGSGAKSCETRDMSKVVAPEDLHSVALPYGTSPFLLHSSNGSVRINHVSVESSEASTEVIVRGFGRGLASRLTPELALSLLWPSTTTDGLSLIADGTGAIDENDPEALTFTVSKAVLHRPAPVDGSPAC